MTTTNITRRRALQGVGAAGLVGIAGNGIVAAGGGEDGAGQQQGSALRLAHASPDAPTVEVRVSEAGTGDATGAGGDGDGGTPTEGDGAGAGTPTDGNGTPGGDDEPLVEGVGFREVSDYTEVEPGTYRLQVVATDRTGLIESIFGGEGDEQVVFDEEVEIAEGTTYTAVAFGELAQVEPGADGTTGETAGETPTPDGTPGSDELGGDEEAGGDGTPAGGSAGGEQVLVEGLSFGDHQYVDLQAREYTLAFRQRRATGDAGVGASDRAFQVTVLEDELSVPGGATAGDSGAGPDEEAGNVSVEPGNATGGEGAGGGEIETPADDGAAGAGDGTPDGEQGARLRVFHAVPDLDAVDVVAVDGDGGGQQSPTPGTPDGETPAADGQGGQPGGGGAPTTQFTAEDGVVYSGFALGYVDPQAAATGADGNDTGAGGNDTGAGGNDTGAGGNDTGVGGGTPTPDGEGDDGIAEDPSGEGFEFVTVVDARDGERADGGTGGILGSVAPQSASSD